LVTLSGAAAQPALGQDSRHLGHRLHHGRNDRCAATIPGRKRNGPATGHPQPHRPLPARHQDHHRTPPGLAQPKVEGEGQEWTGGSLQEENFPCWDRFHEEMSGLRPDQALECQQADGTRLHPGGPLPLE